MAGMARVLSGIDGLDALLPGGLNERSSVILAGGPGTGKTLLAFEFLYRGAQAGETGIYISLKENPEALLASVLSVFSEWSDLTELISQKRIFAVQPDKPDLLSIVDILQRYQSKHEIRRVVIDSASVLQAHSRDAAEFYQAFEQFLKLLSGTDVIVWFLLDRPTVERSGLETGFEEAAVDGVINLYNLDRNDKRVRALEVFKMRGVQHSTDLTPFRVTASGVSLFIGEKV